MPETQFSPENLRRFSPSVRERPEPGVFEIGLVLAGGISAGAYTAGVMDYLIEALDEWCLQKQADRVANRAGTAEQKVPHHDVVLRVIAGTSAGGRNGLIAASLLNYAFRHVSAKGRPAQIALQQPDPRDNENEFFLSWVTNADVEPLLDISDVEGEGSAGLLNDTEQRASALRIVNFRGGPVPRGMRDWLANPYELRLTHTNLRGVPFAFSVRSETPNDSEKFVLHADQLAFSVDSPAGRPQQESSPDCIRLRREDQNADDPGWRALTVAGLATGAVPVIFHANDVDRRTSDYPWRYSYFDMAQGRSIAIGPAWQDNQAPAPYVYPTVDGAVLNNEPFEIARRALAGPRGQNEQSGAGANRAVIMINPLLREPKTDALTNMDSLTVLTHVLPSMLEQAQLSGQDLAQVLDPHIYSRYMISPVRTGESGIKHRGLSAICAGALFAWFGIFSREARQHDYFLGRRNAQQFLKTVFTLPAANSLFGDSRWSEANKTEFRDQTEKENIHYQIIPVYGSAAVEEPKTEWPANAYEARRQRVEQLIKLRVAAFGRKLPGLVRKFMLRNAESKSWGLWFYAHIVAQLAALWLWVGWHAGGSAMLFGKLRKEINKAAAQTRNLRN